MIDPLSTPAGADMLAGLRQSTLTPSKNASIFAEQLRGQMASVGGGNQDKIGPVPPSGFFTALETSASDWLKQHRYSHLEPHERSFWEAYDVETDMLVNDQAQRAGKAYSPGDWERAALNERVPADIVARGEMQFQWGLSGVGEEFMGHLDELRQTRPEVDTEGLLRSQITSFERAFNQLRSYHERNGTSTDDIMAQYKAVVTRVDAMVQRWRDEDAALKAGGQA